MGRHKVPGAVTFIIGLKDFIGASFTYSVHTVLAMANPVSKFIVRHSIRGGSRWAPWCCIRPVPFL